MSDTDDKNSLDADLWSLSQDAWAELNKSNMTDNELFQWQEIVLKEFQEIANKESVQVEASRAMRDAQLTNIVAAHKEIPAKAHREIVNSILDDMFSMGPLENLWKNKEISDMQVFVPYDSREEQIITYASREGRQIYKRPGFRNYGHAMTWLNRHLAQFGQHYDASKVSMDAVFPSGERMHVISGVSGYSVFRKGEYKFVPCVIITMRRFVKAFTSQDLTSQSQAQTELPKFPNLRQVRREYQRKTLYFPYDSKSIDPATMDYLRLMTRMAKNHLISGGTGCHDADAPILMYDGCIKRAADVRVGDRLMGPDNTPRTVINLHQGVDRMVRVTPHRGEPFIVNEGHALALKSTPRQAGEQRQFKTITVSDYQKQSKKFKHIHKLWRANVKFPEKDLIIDPYFLGVLLGDGCIGNHHVAVCTPEKEIVQRVYQEAKNRGLHIRKVGEGTSVNLCVASDTKGEHHKNNLIHDLKALDLYGTHAGDKFIPQIYKTGSRKQRLELLAGILDTDGSWTGAGFDYITKSFELAKDVQFICRSLGYSANISKVSKGFTRKDGSKFSGDYYRIFITGEHNLIPTRVERKKGTPRRQKKDLQVTGFTVEPIGYGEYFGWEVDGDHLYLDGQFLVHHNSGKSTLANALTAETPSGTVLIVLEEAQELQPQNDTHVIRVVQREGVFDLADAVKAALRMYPDRIFIAELRDTLAYTFLRAIQAGQDGSSTTIHSNSCLDAIDVLINFAANHSSHPPREMVKDIIFRRVHTIVHADAFKRSDGISRFIDEVVELRPDQTLHTVMRFHQVGINEDGSVAGYFEFSGPTDEFVEEMFDAGIPIPENWGWTQQ